MKYDQDERSKEIGKLLNAARVERRISVSKCAALLRTTRRRYVEIEAGKSKLSVVELELLCKLLEISVLSIFPQCEARRVHRVFIHSGDLVECILSVDGVLQMTSS